MIDPIFSRAIAALQEELTKRNTSCVDEEKKKKERN